ncbi:BRCA2 repeat family protein [Pelomyxa schiedti]|nr:BRCA2 repeat family protein [Pelomyxa schiedti]
MPRPSKRRRTTSSSSDSSESNEDSSSSSDEEWEEGEGRRNAKGAKAQASRGKTTAKGKATTTTAKAKNKKTKTPPPPPAAAAKSTATTTRRKKKGDSEESSEPGSASDDKAKKKGTKKTKTKTKAEQGSSASSSSSSSDETNAEKSEAGDNVKGSTSEKEEKEEDEEDHAKNNNNGGISRLETPRHQVTPTTSTVDDGGEEKLAGKKRPRDIPQVKKPAEKSVEPPQPQPQPRPRLPGTASKVAQADDGTKKVASLESRGDCWTCRSCSNVNGVDSDNCVKCSKPKPGIEEAVQLQNKETVAEARSSATETTISSALDKKEHAGIGMKRDLPTCTEGSVGNPETKAIIQQLDEPPPSGAMHSDDDNDLLASSRADRSTVKPPSCGFQVGFRGKALLPKTSAADRNRWNQFLEDPSSIETSQPPETVETAEARQITNASGTTTKSAPVFMKGLKGTTIAASRPANSDIIQKILLDTDEIPEASSPSPQLPQAKSSGFTTFGKAPLRPAPSADEKQRVASRLFGDEGASLANKSEEESQQHSNKQKSGQPEQPVLSQNSAAAAESLNLLSSMTDSQSVLSSTAPTSSDPTWDFIANLDPEDLEMGPLPGDNNKFNPIPTEPVPIQTHKDLLHQSGGIHKPPSTPQSQSQKPVPVTTGKVKLPTRSGPSATGKTPSSTRFVPPYSTPRNLPLPKNSTGVSKTTDNAQHVTPPGQSTKSNIPNTTVQPPPYKKPFHTPFRTPFRSDAEVKSPATSSTSKVETKKPASTEKANATPQPSKKNGRITLAQFGEDAEPPRLYTVEELDHFNIKQEVALITSISAETFRFTASNKGSFSGLPPSISNSASVGAQEFRQAMIEAGADAKAVTEAWVHNHFRLIVWKLSSMERRFPQKCGGICLTPGRVLEQLQYRYKGEECLHRPYHSAIRLITQGEARSSNYMILCISCLDKKQPTLEDNNPGGENAEQRGNAPPSKRKQPPKWYNGSGHIIEVTDGWYCINAELDTELDELRKKGNLFVGMKLRVYGAELVGHSVNCLPTELSPGAKLQLGFNGIRRAKWFSKLGFPKEKFFLAKLSSLRQASMCLVPAVDVVIVRKYPSTFMEVRGDSIRYLTKAENAAFTRNYEADVSKLRERIFPQIEKEVEEELRPEESRKALPSDCDDEDDLYVQWQLSSDPHEFFQTLAGNQQHILSNKVERENAKKLEMINSRVQDKLTEDIKPREVHQKMQLKVVECPDLNQSPSSPPTRDYCCIITLSDLTSKEQFREGKWLRVYNLSSKRGNPQKGAALHLTTTSSTQWVPRMKVPPPGFFTPRITLNIGDLSRKCNTGDDFDFVGIVIRSTELESITTRDGNEFCLKVFFIDSSCYIMDITFMSKLERALPLTSSLAPGTIMAFLNLQYEGLDTHYWIQNARTTISTLYSGRVMAKYPHIKQAVDETKNWQSGPLWKKHFENGAAFVDRVVLQSPQNS